MAVGGDDDKTGVPEEGGLAGGDGSDSCCCCCWLRLRFTMVASKLVLTARSRRLLADFDDLRLMMVGEASPVLVGTGAADIATVASWPLLSGLPVSDAPFAVRKVQISKVSSGMANSM